MDSIELLKKLVTIKSYTMDQANDALDFLRRYLKSNGIYGEIIENNGYKSYVTSIGNGPKTLVLNGHLDVVSGKASQFNPIEMDGKIIGRGTADMKSGCVAMVQTLIRLKDHSLDSKVMLQLVTDEETGGINCTNHLVKKGYIGDFVICTEPTNLEISIQAKGILRINIETYGKPAHGSRPWEGDNAILKAYRNFEKIKKLEILNESSKFYKKSSVNLAFLKGGDIYNRVPEKSVMGLDIRYVPHLNPTKIIEAIEAVVDGKVIIKAIEAGVNCLSTNEHINKLSQSVTKVLPERKIKYIAQHGGSDGRFFAQKGIPTVEFGPVGHDWHGDEEYVEKKSIYQLEEILVDFIKNF